MGEGNERPFGMAFHSSPGYSSMWLVMGGGLSCRPPHCRAPVFWGCGALGCEGARLFGPTIGMIGKIQRESCCLFVGPNFFPSPGTCSVILPLVGRRACAIICGFRLIHSELHLSGFSIKKGSSKKGCVWVGMGSLTAPFHLQYIPGQSD